MENTGKTFAALIDQSKCWFPTLRKAESWTITLPARAGVGLARASGRLPAPRPTLRGGCGGLQGPPLTCTPHPASGATHNWVFPSWQFVCLTFLRQDSPDLVFLSTHHHFFLPHAPSLHHFILLLARWPELGGSISDPLRDSSSRLTWHVYSKLCANLKQTIWKCFIHNNAFLKSLVYKIRWSKTCHGKSYFSLRSWRNQTVHLSSFVLLCRLDRKLAEHKLSPLETVHGSNQQEKALSSHLWMVFILLGS